MPDIIPTTKNILIVAGDPSGDVHGANLIRALKALDPEITVAALGGSRMQEVSDRFIYNLVGLGAAGFAEPFKRMFLWLRLIGLVRRYMEEKRPACVITVDFYGFNHQVLGLAAHRKIPAFYFVSPQVWASRPKRAERIAKLTKRVLSIFPFEPAIYEKVGGKCTFVGHPLLDIMPSSVEPPKNRKSDYEWKIGILPGSRPQEVSRHMPVFWESFLKVKQSFPNARAYIFAAKEISDETLVSLCKNSPAADVNIVREDNYARRKEMDVVIAASGTATLENALLGVPMVVAYQLPWFTYQIAKRVITVPYISLVNILARKALVREFIQHEANSTAISGQIMAMLQNPVTLENMRAELLGLAKQLGEPGACKRAAEIIHAEVFSGS